jgi:hypothetical protein
MKALAEPGTDGHVPGTPDKILQEHHERQSAPHGEVHRSFASECHQTPYPGCFQDSGWQSSYRLLATALSSRLFYKRLTSTFAALLDTVSSDIPHFELTPFLFGHSRL